YEGLEAQLGEIEFQRQTAESLLEHLRAEHAKAVSAAQVSEAELVREFYAEPEVADRAADLKDAKDKFNQARRVSRAGSDPSLVGLGKRIKELEAELGRMWQQRKAGLQARLAGAGDDQAIRQAASEVMTLRAKEAALGERLDQFKEQRLPELEAKHDRLVKQHGQAQAAALLKSIEQGLKSVEGMRAEVEQRFQNDLAESNKSEIVQLAESNLRNNLERQRALFYYYSAMSDNCRCHKSLFFRNLSHFCEFRLELGLWIKIPVKQATFSQSAFEPSAEVLVLQRLVRQLSMAQAIIFQELKSFLQISIRTWLMDQNPCETSHFLAIGVLTQRCSTRGLTGLRYLHVERHRATPSEKTDPGGGPTRS